MIRFAAFALTFLFLTCSVLSAAHAQPVCVQRKNAQLRKGPGTNFPVTWAVGQYMPFMKLAEKNGWAQVKDLDNQTHWVIASALTQRYGCAVVKTRQARLRREPSTRSPAAEPELVDRYTPFKKIDRNGSWIQVQDDHQSEFWMSETQLWIPTSSVKVAF